MENILSEIKDSNLSEKLKVVTISNLFIGQEEIRGNKGFKDEIFELYMKKTGWQKGWAWCACFCEMVYDIALPHIETKLEPLFSAGCTKTLENFRNAGYDVSMKPEEGSVMIMQKDGSWQGHAGIVSHVDGDIVYTVEGNTNSSGGREGFEVARKKRKYKDTSKSMDVVGFIKIV